MSFIFNSCSIFTKDKNEIAQGQVIDSFTFDPVEGAIVELRTESKGNCTYSSVFTDANGRFILPFKFRSSNIYSLAAYKGNYSEPIGRVAAKFGSEENQLQVIPFGYAKLRITKTGTSKSSIAISDLFYFSSTRQTPFDTLLKVTASLRAGISQSISWTITDLTLTTAAPNKMTGHFTPSKNDTLIYQITYN